MLSRKKVQISPNSPVEQLLYLLCSCGSLFFQSDQECKDRSSLNQHKRRDSNQNIAVKRGEKIKNYLDWVSHEIEMKIDSHTTLGSGWELIDICRNTIELTDHKRLALAGGFIEPSPAMKKIIKGKHQISNVIIQ